MRGPFLELNAYTQPSVSVPESAQAILDLANKLEVIVSTEHNGVTFSAYPGMEFEEVLLAWERSYERVHGHPHTFEAEH